jgi:hypothetical protein
MLDAHWRYHVDVFNNIGVLIYLIINMMFPSNTKLWFLWNDRIAILQHIPSSDVDREAHTPLGPLQTAIFTVQLKVDETHTSRIKLMKFW